MRRRIPSRRSGELKKQLKKSDRLFFLIGMDAFKEFSTWREPEALLRETEFIVMNRPGWSLGEVGASLPESLRPPCHRDQSHAAVNPRPATSYLRARLCIYLPT